MDGPPAGMFTDRALTAAARLLRSFHDATRGRTCPSADWRFQAGAPRPSAPRQPGFSGLPQFGAMRPKRMFAMVAAAAGAVLLALTMTAGPALADTDGTTTTLHLPASRVIQGLEPSFVMSIDTNALTGNWVIQAGSPTFKTVTLCGSDVGSKSCAMSANALPPGNYNVFAIYLGDENFSGSGSAALPLTVLAQQPTSTTLSLSTPSVVVGHEDSELIQVRTTGDTGNAASGPVTVMAGSAPVSASCTNLALFEGAGSCSLPSNQLPAGTYQLTAVFGGSRDFAASVSAPQTLTVLNLQPTTVGLTLTAPSVPFGNEQSDIITARVTPSIGGIPTGVITVRSGATVLCTLFLSGGSVPCPLSATQLRPGTYPLTVTYSGDNTYAGSTGQSSTLTVTKGTTTTVLAMSADIIAVGSEQAELFSVEVDPSFGGAPTGNVTVKAGVTAVCTIVLTNQTGSCSLTKKQLAKGTYDITATYNGDATYATSISSPPQTLTVNPK